MRQYDFERASHDHSAWSAPSKEPREHERALPAAPEPLIESSPASETLAGRDGSIPMRKLAASAGQVHARSSLLRLQRHHGNHYVQRFLQRDGSPDSKGDVVPGVERAIESSRGGGQSLDDGVHTQIGNALNADFSGVRVHTNAEADDLNRSLSARAFTTGQDIYFRQGEYNPGSSRGRELLAHELTHVVQQNPDQVQRQSEDQDAQAGRTSGHPTPGVQMKLSVSQPGDSYEQEADQVASAVMHQEQQPSARSSKEQPIHRQMPEEDKDKLQSKFIDDQIRRQMEEEEKKPA